MPVVALARRAIGPILLFTFVLTVYLPSTRLGFVHDDQALVLNEPVSSSARGLFFVFVERQSDTLPYYRPVSRLTMVAQKYLHGNSPAAFHLVNAILMASLAVATYGLFRAPALGIPQTVALLGAGLLAVHPASSCIVYPICSGRESLLPALFIILAVSCYISARKGAYLAALALFTLGLLSKEQAVVVPVLFLLADTLGISAAGKPKTLGGWLRRYTPVFLILLAYLFVRSQIVGMVGGHRLALFEQPFGPVLSVVFTVQTILTPFAQLVYEPTVEVWASVTRAILCVLVVMVVAAGIYLCWSTVRSRLLFWLGWGAVVLLPMANILYQEAAFAERYVVLSLVGVIGILATLVATVWDQRSARVGVVATTIVLIGVGAAISVQRGRYYQDDLTFFRQWLATSPHSSEAHACMGLALFRNGKPDEAIAEYAEALRGDPNNVPAYVYLGQALAQRGRLPEAFEVLQHAVELGPSYAAGQAMLGTLLARTGNLPQAATHLRLAAEGRPRDAITHHLLGRVLAQLEELDEAQAHLEQAIQIRPDFVEALTDLGAVLEKRNGPDSVSAARDCFRRAIEIDPHFADAHFNLGVSYVKQGDLKRGAAEFETVLSIDPRHPLAGEFLRQTRELIEAPEPIPSP